mgnify:CR=1 FL=1
MRVSEQHFHPPSGSRVFDSLSQDQYVNVIFINLQIHISCIYISMYLDVSMYLCLYAFRGMAEISLWSFNRLPSSDRLLTQPSTLFLFLFLFLLIFLIDTLHTRVHRSPSLYTTVEAIATPTLAVAHKQVAQPTVVLVVLVPFICNSFKMIFSRIV